MTMRTYGRIFALNPDGTKRKPQPAGYPQWVEVQTDPATGSNSWVYVTALCQVLQGNLGESPFYANYGLAAQQSVIQQIAPDYSISQTQQQFSQYFASLIISRDPAAAGPTYEVNATTFEGTPVSVTVQVPH